MKLVPKIILILIILSCYFGCSSHSDGSNVTQAVTIIYKGAVVPNPVSTTVSIDPYFINYSQAQSGAIIGGWSKPIQPADFTLVWKVIDDNKLYESGDVLPVGGPPCVGSQGMTIRIYKDNSVHSFDIYSGAVCVRTQWPAGVRDLVEHEEALVNKYQ
jgi:hypothetical protein